MSRFTLGLVQLCSRDDLAANLRKAEEGVRRARERGADLVMLPENFSFMGPPKQALSLAEEPGHGPVTATMSEVARQHGVHLLLGGFPEKSPDTHRVYNTSLLYSPSGEVLARYRKMHLFDIYIRDAIDRLESDTVYAGDTPVMKTTPLAGMGLAICYDIRFPELFRRMALRGAEIFLVTAAFTQYTGKDHWMPLLRARAIENTTWLAAAAQFGKHDGVRTSYGHTCLIDPWGNVLAQAPDREFAVVVGEVDLDMQQEIRERMPTLRHVREDLVHARMPTTDGGSSARCV